MNAATVRAIATAKREDSQADQAVVIVNASSSQPVAMREHS
jgi:hypothetical protein